MSAITRTLVGFGSIGGVASTGYLLGSYLSTEDIRSKLKANEYTLLGFESTNDATWQEILDNYKIVATKDSKYKFDDFLGRETNSKALDILKQKCKETLEKKLSENKVNELYEKAKKWCTTPVSIIELSKKENFVALKTDEDDTETNKSEWTQKINDFKKEKDEKKKIDLEELSKEKDGSKIAEDIKKIKKRCREVGKLKNHSDNFEDSLEKFKIWCSIKEKPNKK